MVVLQRWPFEPVYAPTPRSVAAQKITPAQKKQVYLTSSAILPSAKISASPRGPYENAWQVQVVSEIAEARATPRPREVALPSPRDIKATMLQGNGAVQVGNSKIASRLLAESASVPKMMQFGVGSEPIKVLQVNRQDLDTKSEYWSGSPRMDWSDTRGEFIRRQEVKDSLKGMNPGARKLKDMSSQVLGGSAEFWGAGAPPPKLSPRLRPGTFGSAPMTARDRHGKHLSTSRDSTLPTSQSAQTLPGVTRRVSEAFRDSTDEEMKRSDSQFSNLFDRTWQTEPRSPRKSGRSEAHDAVNSTWADAKGEISSRNAQRARRTDNNSIKDSVGTIIHCPGPMVDPALISPRSLPETPQERQHRLEERASWDSASGMQAEVELARRRRSYRAAASPVGSPLHPAKDMTAPERKMANLASGQFRRGTGAANEPHDEPSSPAWSLSGTKRTTVSPAPSAAQSVKSNLQSCAMRQFSHISPNSPRGRKLQEMMTTQGIF
eukprot:TRINITY_DN23300_c0_g6_i1.p1 TRINITY_DN23300_c0_g6~~TRINITY_DN23300_c0_g6_i1.p1  ORF type:complete len:493 (+),score=81.35 TRINITY_DN23300_c0_g6_i1:132-1610(+)